jgi:predicted anti-sigma-YlaC factor YlaD
MVRAMDLAQMSFRQMRINLGGRDVAVTEHLLDCAQIRAAFQQMGSETVAQRVRAYP